MGIDRKKVAKQTAEAAQRSGRFRYLKKNSTTTLRVLEYKDNDGDTVFATLQTEHRKISGDAQKAEGICRRATFGQPCAYCRINTMADDSGKTKPYNSRSRYVINAIDVNDDPKRVKLFVIPASVFDQMAELALSDEWGDIFEAEKGVPINVKREGSGLDTEYTSLPGRKPLTVSKEIMKQVVNPLTEIRDVGCEGQCEEIGCKMEQLWTTEEIEELTKDTSKTKKPAAGKAKKEEPESEAPADDESGEFEVGEEVRVNGEDDVIYHISAINGTDYVVEDEKGDEYDVTEDELLKLEVDADGVFNVGDIVHYQDEEDTCEITALDGSTATIKDSNGDEFEFDIDTLSLAQDEDVEEKPKCFGKEDMFDESDKECKKCDFLAECGGNVELDKAGVGKHKPKKTEKKKASADDDDFINSIVGSK